MQGRVGALRAEVAGAVDVEVGLRERYHALMGRVEGLQGEVAGLEEEKKAWAEERERWEEERRVMRLTPTITTGTLVFSDAKFVEEEVRVAAVIINRSRSQDQACSTR